MSELEYQVVITEGDGYFETDNHEAMDFMHWGPRKTEQMGKYIVTALKGTTQETMYADAYRQMVADGYQVMEPQP